MPLSREFRGLVAARTENDPDFRQGLIVEAINMHLMRRKKRNQFLRIM
jgi:hypothetical protein